MQRRRWKGLRGAVPLCVCLVALAACTGSGDPASFELEPVPPPSVAPAGEAPQVVTDECAPRRRATVENLPDLSTRAVHVGEVAVRSGGATRTLAPGFVVPAQHVDAGCIIRYDAPGGCLGAVRITAATIPAVTIPSTDLPEADLGGTTLPAKQFPAVHEDAVVAPAVSAPQVCQVRRQGRVETVTREGVVRPGVARPGLARQGGTRPGGCGSSRCYPEIRLDAVRLEPVRVPAVDVEPARLRRRELPGSDVGVLEGDDETAFVAPAAVLFTRDSAALRAGAGSALRDIAREVARSGPRPRLRVDGYTDDLGSAAHGLDLSRRRARAVAVWLSTEAGFDRSDIVVRAFGERFPAVPNTSEANRRQNRRVVVTLLEARASAG